jgi:hypothetical protein
LLTNIENLDRDKCAKVLARLVSNLDIWKTNNLKSLLLAWQTTLHRLAQRTRQNLLGDISALTPFIHALGGDKAIVETFHAIQDVGEWWP